MMMGKMEEGFQFEVDLEIGLRVKLLPSGKVAPAGINDYSIGIVMSLSTNIAIVIVDVLYGISDSVLTAGGLTQKADGGKIAPYQSGIILGIVGGIGYKDMYKLYIPYGIASGGGGSYVLPTATETRLGGVKTGIHTSTDEDGVLDVTTGGDIDQIPTNFHVAENHYTKEEADVGSDTKPGEMDIRSPKIEFYGEKTKYSYYNVSDGESLTDITTDKVSKKQIMFLSASKRDSASVVYFHEDYLKDRPQVTIVETLQGFYLDINGMRFNTSRYNVPVDAGYRITYNGKVTLNGNPINTNENNFVENSKSGTYDTKAFDNTNIDHMFTRARIEIVSTSTAEMNIIADPTSKLFALKMTSNHLLTFMKIQPLFFQDVKASIVQGQKNRYEISQEYVQELLESALYTGFLDISIDLEI